MAYPLPISRFEDEGTAYVESTSIKRQGKFTKLNYVENYNERQNYGESSYKSKVTSIRIDCRARRVFALSEAFYSGPNLSGVVLGSFPLHDNFGSNAEHGSWVSEVVKLGCSN